MSKRQRTISVVVAMGLLIGLFLVLRGRRGSEASAAAVDAVQADRDDVEAAARRAPKRPVREGGMFSDAFLTSDQLTKSLATYKKMAVYPIWSRPHDEGSRYLLHWNDVAGTQAFFDNEPGHELYYLYEADRNHVNYGDAITSTLRVYDGSQKAARFEIADAYVVIMSGPRQGRYLKLDYHDDGRDGDKIAGDGVFTNRFTPADHDALSTPEQAKLVAEIVIDGKMKLAERQFGYSPRPVLDVIGLREDLEAGSLAVTVDVDVREAGGYNFQANLVTASGEVPVAWLDMHFNLALGRQQVKLVFFGKAIRDIGASGPFLVRDLRGYLSLSNPDTTLWWSDEHTITTRAYATTDFSPVEWDDDEKRARIANFEKLISETKEQETYGTGAPAKLVELGPDGVRREVPYPDEAPPERP
jgi:hypothetical protein